MNNNKGQVLIMFVLLIPLFIMLLAYVFNTSTLYINKSHIENNVKEALKTGLENKTNNLDNEQIELDIKELINKNTKNIKLLKVTVDEKISVTLKVSINSLFTNIFKDSYDVLVKYNGYINNDKIIIERDK